MVNAPLLVEPDKRTQTVSVAGVAYRVDVTAIILDEQNRVFFGLAENGRYQLPEGGIKPDETLGTALWRKIKQETGIPSTKVRLFQNYRTPVGYKFEGADAGEKPWDGQARYVNLLLFSGAKSDIQLNASPFLRHAWVHVSDAMDETASAKHGIDPVHSSIVNVFSTEIMAVRPEERRSRLKVTDLPTFRSKYLFALTPR